MTTVGRLGITSATVDGTVSIALEGELDLAGASQLEESLAAAEKAQPTQLIVDLGRLAFIDSTGLRLLLQADARARERGCEMLLRPGGPAVQRALEVTGALTLLRFEDQSGD